MGVFGFESNATISRCLFLRTDEVTANTADMSGSQFVDCKAAADGACVIWDVAADPDTYLENTDFDSTNSPNAIHAIEFGTNSPTSMTLRGIDFTGFNATTGQNDSTFNILRNTGSVSINLVDCTSDVTLTNSYKTAGATVTITANTSITLTGLVNGTEVSVYDAVDGTEIAHVEDVTGNQFTFADVAGNVIDIFIHKEDYYRADILNYTVPGSTTSIPIQQVFDPNYRNP
jgi:hypothetical protein